MGESFTGASASLRETMGTQPEWIVSSPPAETGAMTLDLRGHRFDLTATPLVMGILNVTPDSFSDGGDHEDPACACKRAIEMIEQGADIIDVGPESTRPGAAPVLADQQIDRAVPVIEAIRAANDAIPISIDTRLASVARAALDVGADMVNDVSALRDDEDMAGVVERAAVPVVLMHRRGFSSDMQEGGGPEYDDVIGAIAGFFRERMAYAEGQGIPAERIVLDPGIGFGKRVEHNLLILRDLDRLVALGRPVLVGASRKSFIGSVLQIDEPGRRDPASLACAVMAVMAGCGILRVHDVRATADAVRICQAVRSARVTSVDGR